MSLEKTPKRFQVFSYQFGPYLLDLEEQRLLRDGQPVAMTPKVFDLLRLLVQHSGHLLTKEQLLKEIWPETFVEEANLSRAVSVLRKALGDGLPDEKYVETVSKRGYRFVAPVSIGARVDDDKPVGTQSVATEPTASSARARVGCGERSASRSSAASECLRSPESSPRRHRPSVLDT